MSRSFTTAQATTNAETYAVFGLASWYSLNKMVTDPLGAAAVSVAFLIDV